MTRGRLLVAAGIVILFSGATYGAVRVYKLAHYTEWHARVVYGDSEHDVRAMMGSPDVVVSGPSWYKAPGTVRSFLYGHSWPPEWWIVELDARHRVTCTIYVQSP